MGVKQCLSERTKNIVLSAICMSMCMMATFPAAAIQNIALAESTNIDLHVGYYSEVVRYVGCMAAGLTFYPFFKFTGIKITAATITLLITLAYWPMIWIINQYVIYVSYFLSGIGLGSLWILWPMVVVDNSKSGQAQKNMGYWWMAESLGPTLGGLLGYFYFQSVSKISTENRRMVYGMCGGVTVLSALIATVFVSDIKKSSKRHKPLTDEEMNDYDIEDEKEQIKEGGKDDEVLTKGFGDKEKQISQEPGQVNALEWFKEMRKIKEFWILLLPLIYWGFIWGYFVKMMPTATASITDRRDMIPLIAMVSGVGFLVGSACWTAVTKKTGNTFAIVVATLMLFVAITLSLLIFPKGAASEVLELETIETYITPHWIYLVVISALIGLADSGVSIIYYTTAGRIYGEGTSLGFSINNIGFCVFYIVSMFAPSLFDLHSYCYCMYGAVLLMCLSFLVGLKKYMH